jgi:hypothetical protein
MSSGFQKNILTSGFKKNISASFCSCNREKIIHMKNIQETTIPGKQIMQVH